MYPILLSVRIVYQCSVLLFLVVSYRANRPPVVDRSLILVILFFMLADALLSRANTRIAESVPSNRIAAMFYKVSPFAWPEPSKNYRTVCAVFIIVLLAGHIIRMST